MKVLLSNDFSNAMMKQGKEAVANFVSSIEKLNDMTKTQILSQDAVVDLSSPEGKTKLFAYNLEGSSYVIFSFTKKNDMLLIDYIKLRNGGVVSLVYPDKSTAAEED